MKSTSGYGEEIAYVIAATVGRDEQEIQKKVECTEVYGRLAKKRIVSKDHLNGPMGAATKLTFKNGGGGQ